MLPASEGRGIRDEPVAKAQPVRISVMVGDDVSATRISLAENLQRSAKNTDEGRNCRLPRTSSARARAETVV